MVQMHLKSYRTYAVTEQVGVPTGAVAVQSPNAP